MNTSIEIEVDATATEPETNALPITKWPRKKRNHYLGKLRLLGTIHVEIANALEKQREAYAFSMVDDDYLPADRKNDLLILLALDIHEPSEPSELLEV